MRSSLRLQDDPYAIGKAFHTDNIFLFILLTQCFNWDILNP